MMHVLSNKINQVRVQFGQTSKVQVSTQVNLSRMGRFNDLKICTVTAYHDWKRKINIC